MGVVRNCRLMVVSPSLLMTNHPWKGRVQGHVTHYRILHHLKYLCNGYAYRLQILYTSWPDILKATAFILTLNILPQQNDIIPCSLWLFFDSVDATEEIGSTSTLPKIGRLVNHGNKTERNSRMKVCSGSDGPVLALYATRPICVNEEIRYDYGIRVPWMTRFVYKCVS